MMIFIGLKIKMQEIILTFRPLFKNFVTIFSNKLCLNHKINLKDRIKMISYFKIKKF